MSSEKAQQLHLLQQNLQNTLVQKQQMESHLTELNSALSELKETDKSYKIVGKIMISTPKEELSKNLENEKEVAEVRMNSFQKQETALKENIEKLQKEVVEKLKK